MSSAMNEHTETNRRHWDEVVPLHVASEMYDVEGFRASKSRLHPIELEELGDVRGKSLLHLQCHFGLDTLSWATQGAAVTGIDFSEPAIDTARKLAAELEIDARFLVSDIYALPENLEGQFDIVFTSYGVLTWLPDIPRWAKVAAHFVRPGGTFYIVEFHPMTWTLENEPGITDDIRLAYPYFPTGDALDFEEDGTYAQPDAKVEHRRTFEWPHPVSEVVTALIDAGLRIEFLHEFPHTTWRFLPFMEPAGDRMFRLTKHDGQLPLLYSVRATKPE